MPVQGDNPLAKLVDYLHVQAYNPWYNYYLYTFHYTGSQGEFLCEKSQFCPGLTGGVY